MGACDLTREYIKVPVEILKEMVSADRENDISQYGSDPYSGTWGAKESGLTLTTDSVNEEEAWKKFTNDKWSCVEASLIKPKNYVSKIEKEDIVLSARVEQYKKLQEDKINMISSFLEERKTKRKTVTCISCNKKTNIDLVTYTSSCPHCKKRTFFVSKTEQKKIDVQNKRIKAAKDKIEARKRALKIDKESIKKIDNMILEKYRKWCMLKNEKEQKITGFHTCKNCRSRINTDAIFSSSNKQCPVCHHSFINSSIAQKSRKLFIEIKELSKLYSAVTGEYWFVGGMCPE